MPKSKHPPLLKKALANIKDMDKIVKKDIASFKEIAKSCARSQKTASGAAAGFSTKLDYMKDVMEKYATKVVEIEQLESDMAGVKGEKKQADLNKKLAKAEKEADAQRSAYNAATKVFRGIADTVAMQMGLLQKAADKVASGWP